MKNTAKAYVAITTQALIIGFSFLFVKIALRSADTFTLLAHRFTVATVFLLIYSAFHPGNRRMKRSDWLKIMPYSLAYPISFFLFQTLGLKIISSSEAGIIQATAPVLTLIAAGIVLKERIGRVQKLFILASVSGVIFINALNGFSLGNYSYQGFFFIFLSAMSFAVYNVMIKKMSKTYSVDSIVYVMTITSGVVFNGISIGMHAMSGSLSTYFEPFMSPTFVWAILYLGVLSSLVTSLLSTYALGKLEATKVGLFSNVSTAVTILAGMLFLNESLYWYHYVGIAAILVGTLGFNLTKFQGAKSGE